MKYSKLSDFSDEEFCNIIKSSYSYRDALLNMGMNTGKYQTLKNRMSCLELSENNFLKRETKFKLKFEDKYIKDSKVHLASRDKHELVKNKILEKRIYSVA